MRKQIAAANWKMNLTLQQAETLIDELLAIPHELEDNQSSINVSACCRVKFIFQLAAAICLRMCCFWG